MPTWNWVPLWKVPEMSDWDRKCLLDLKIRTTQKLLELGSSPAGRRALVDATDIRADDMLAYVNAADLFRIKGIGSRNIRLVRLAGCKTVRDLGCRNFINLHRDICNINHIHNVSKISPAQRFVTSWIDQAKRLELVITYKPDYKPVI